MGDSWRSMANPHRVSYVRIVKGRRLRVCSEVVDDYGFYLGLTRKLDVCENAAAYAAALLEDSLHQASSSHLRHPGHWLVIVDRINPDGSERRVCVTDVEVLPNLRVQMRRHAHSRACRCDRRKEIA
ncbi:hypothetical protein GCM10012275_13000 [Longimycelium tulufanense]|uniref:Uncharacterized protein n=1 Tax=Longimycelium tulufanense TaxID=907463 RepID=A0A8J3CBJ6_9PSEU|nr:hypothetical protein [Longimycelium tulufanense]GGM43445.1 hypothetical protein GCM10012275_13000 [Longimycelium tulufanense]